MASVKEWQGRFEVILGSRTEASQDGSHDIGHFHRVWHNCQTIAAEEGLDSDPLVLVAAAYLHDLVNPLKNAPDRHLASQRSAEEASAILKAENLPPDKIAPVAHAILTHSFSAGHVPETVEARILQDADRLDSLGAIGLARTFYVAGSMGSLLFDPSDPWAQDREPDDKRFALDHFDLKLLRLVETMRTESGRRLAQKRTDYMRSFLDELRGEFA